MKRFEDLVKKENIFHIGNNRYIKEITNNTKQVKKDSLFIAIKGTKFDGHFFVEESLKKGANSVVIQNKKIAENLKNKYPEINIALVENTRIAQAEIASNFFDNPSNNLKIIGVTGTNGKTSVTHLLSQYLNYLYKPVGIIGTISYKFQEKIYDAGRTTPDSIQWQNLLFQMKKDGAKFISAEVSSHAIDQYRVYSTKFEGGIFTNLSQDHLDYHKTIQNYFETKKSFFEYIVQTNSNAVISINIDDEYGKQIYEQLKNHANIITYGQSKNANFRLKNLNSDLKGINFEYEYKGITKKIHSKLRGDFNIYNIAAAFSFLVKYGFDEEKMIQISENLKPIKGRFEIIQDNGFLVVNDYAHTPDALEKILISLNKIKKNRILVVFGAGGDRDKTKRPKMGEVAQKFSDMVILTSDNPRSENPLKIIEDIKQGMNINNIYEIVDREEAIKKAIQMAEEGDIVLIAGKGHETYQIIGDKIYHFDDSDVAKKYLK